MLPRSVAQNDRGAAARCVCTPRDGVALSKESPERWIRAEDRKEFVGHDRFAERETTVAIGYGFSNHSPMREPGDCRQCASLIPETFELCRENRHFARRTSRDA